METLLYIASVLTSKSGVVYGLLIFLHTCMCMYVGMCTEAHVGVRG